MRSRHVVVALLAVTALGVAVPDVAVAAVTVTVVDLPLPAGATGTVADLNDAGTAVGTVTLNGVGTAARWDGQTRTDLTSGTTPGSTGAALRVNALGLVAGLTTNPNFVGRAPSRWFPTGTLQVLGVPQPDSVTITGVNSNNLIVWSYRTFRGTSGANAYSLSGNAGSLPLSDANAVDDAGRVAGGFGSVMPGSPPTPQYVPRVSQVGGSTVTLPIPAGQYGSAYGFGPGDLVVGALGTLNLVGNGGFTFAPQQAVIWENNTLTQLGTLGGATSSPITDGRGVNQAGTIAGNSKNAAGQTHAFVWSGGQMTDLGTLGGATSVATALNDNGDVVGQSTTADGATHAFLWRDGEMTDLGAPDGTASTAVALNENNQIVGTVTRADGPHPVLWTID